MSELGIEDYEAYSNVYKSVWGYRPNPKHFETREEFNEEMVNLQKIFEVHRQQDIAAKRRAVDDFNGRVKMYRHVMPGITNQDIVRHLMDAFQTESQEGLEWWLDLPFGHLEIFIKE